MEKDRESYPQDTVDAAPRDTSRRESMSSTRAKEEGRNGREASCPTGGFEKFKKFESSRGCQSEHEGGRAGTSKHLASLGRDQREQPLEPLEPLELDKLEERFRKECRKSCRRNLLVELLKTVAKVAGVILAAMGLSSFGEED